MHLSRYILAVGLTETDFDIIREVMGHIFSYMYLQLIQGSSKDTQRRACLNLCGSFEQVEKLCKGHVL